MPSTTTPGRARTHRDDLISASADLELRGIVTHALKPKTKIPAMPNWQNATETDYSMITSDTWGIGVLCGELSGVTVVDIDDVGMWGRIVKHFDAVNDFSNVPTVATPSGGIHYYFDYNSTVRTASHVIISKVDGQFTPIDIDTRNDGGQAVTPPSIYHTSKPEKSKFNGKKYEWDPLGFGDVEGREPIPGWLLGLLTNKTMIVINAGELSVIDVPVKPPKTLTLESSGSTDWTQERAMFVATHVGRHRATTYDSWMKGCFAIGSIGETWCEDVVEAFAERSTGSNVDLTASIRLLNVARGSVGMATMVQWLEEDDDEAFKEYKKIYAQEREAIETIETIAQIAEVTEDFPKFEFEIPEVDDDTPTLVKTPYPLEYYEMLSNGDEGCSTLYKDLKGEDVVISDLKFARGYMFNSQNNLWEPVEALQIQNSIPEILGPVAARRISDTKAEIRKAAKLLMAGGKETAETKEARKTMDTALKNWERIDQRIKSSAGCKAIFSMLTTKLYNPKFEEKLNKRRDLLPLRESKKCIDLRNKCVIDLTRDHMFSLAVQANYTPNSRYENVNKLMDSITLDKPDLKRDLQKILGASLTGYADQRVMFILIGRGKNGKSVIKKILSGIFGCRLYADIPKSAIIMGAKQTSNAHTAHLEPLRGARVGIIDETADTDVFDSSSVKVIASCENISMRMIGGKQESMPINISTYLLTNEVPRFNINYNSMSDKKALQERMCVVPFEAHFVPHPTRRNDRRQDTAFTESFLSGPNRDEFFSWLVDGASLALNEGFNELSNSIVQATKCAIWDADSLQEFIDTNYEQFMGSEDLQNEIHKDLRKEWRVKANDFYTEYTTFLRDVLGEKQTNIMQVSIKTITTAMGGKGFIKGRSNGTVYYGLKKKEGINSTVQGHIGEISEPGGLEASDIEEMVLEDDE